jgi:PAS domain S-box-containing protein
MAFTVEQVTLVWPPAASHWRRCSSRPGDRPGIFLGAFIANVTTHEPIGVALAIAAGNTLEAIVAGQLIRRAIGRQLACSWLRTMLAIVVGGAMVSTIVSATIGAASLCLGGLQPWTAFATLWRTWWLGDAAADLIIVPAVLAFSARPRAHAWPSRLEIGALAVGLAGVSVAVFARHQDLLFRYPLEYLVFPFLIWAAIRFGIAGVAYANVLTAAVRLPGAFAGRDHERLLLLQIFLSVMATSGLLLGATVSDQDAARMRKAGMLEAALDCIISMDHTGRIIEFNPAAEQTFGYTSAQAIGRDFAELLLPELLRDFHRRAISRYHRLGDLGLLGRRYETMAMRAGGTEFPVELSVSHVPTTGPATFTAFIVTSPSRSASRSSSRSGTRRAHQRPEQRGVHGAAHARGAPGQHRRPQGHRGAVRGSQQVQADQRSLRPSGRQSRFAGSGARASIALPRIRYCRKAGRR